MKKMLCILGMMTLTASCTSMYSNNDDRKKEESRNENKEYTLINSDITIMLDEEMIYGFAGVNRYFAQYKKEKDNISIGNIGSTMMLGPEDAMQKEQEFLETLPKMKKINITEDKIILSGDESELIFTK